MTESPALLCSWMFLVWARPGGKVLILRVYPPHFSADVEIC